MGATDIRVRDQGKHGDDCRATAEILARIGDKWSALIIAALSSGEAVRYNELHRRVRSISQRMLTLTLKGLEQDGLVHREQFPTIPPRVEYRLTDLGTSLLPPLRALLDWANMHGSTMMAERARSARGPHVHQEARRQVAPPYDTEQAAEMRRMDEDAELPP